MVMVYNGSVQLSLQWCSIAPIGDNSKLDQWVGSENEKGKEAIGRNGL